ncbi:MAG: FAD-dependent oxidoreductase [Alphaproteobacteria bacterium]|nr:FAD-dependent oxidoreductase [Alphaproteobacteria bacterium]
MGLSAAWALARAGHRVEVLDQGPVPNPQGASVDDHRLIRFPYGAQDGYVRMVGAAFGAWEELWRDLGRRLFVETGTLAFDQGRPGWAAQSRAGLARCGIAYEMLTPGEMARRFPILDSSGIAEALYLPSGGALMAGQIVAALAQHLAARGVVVHSSQPVTGLDPDQGEVRLADRRRIRAGRIVVAAGPWAPRLLPGLARRVTPSRQVVAYLQPPAELADAWSRTPMILAIDPENGFYAVPPVAGLGLKIGDHRFTLRGDPDREREPSDEEALAIAGLCRERFRNFPGYRIATARTCFYDVEPEERFILEPLGARGWLMSGFSGHGFKFAPLLGLRLATAIGGGLAPATLTRWAAGQET